MYLGLEDRGGLSDALKVLVRDYPRTGWQTHENFTGMVQVWLDRHLMFQRLLNALELDVARRFDGQLDAQSHAHRLSRYGGHLRNDLHMHHQIEDHHYFPKLIGLDDRISTGFDLLEADHQQIDPLWPSLPLWRIPFCKVGKAGLWRHICAGCKRRWTVI